MGAHRNYSKDILQLQPLGEIKSGLENWLGYTFQRVYSHLNVFFFIHIKYKRSGLCKHLINVFNFF